MNKQLKNRPIKGNLYDLYASYQQHKWLFEFWKKNRNIKNENDIRERLKYLKNNSKAEQRDEINTLLWILNESSD